MFEALAGMVMTTKIHFSQMKYPFIKKKDRIVAEKIYQNEVRKIEEFEKYEKSNLPESGYMTVEEYEAKSRAKSRKEMSEDVKGGEVPKDSNMVYVPERNFKLIKYNNPVGSPELSIPRKLNFDRQVNAQGIISGDKTMLVYPALYYYAAADCTSCDLFLIKLKPKFKDVEKVINANIVERELTPLISTDKSIDDKYVFRTLTPIDFSMDNKKLVVKEKIGFRHDGIWKTELWVYDFETNEALKMPQIREAIINYWAETEGIDFDENRWDIYPMGFDANNPNRIILSAYAYTGDVPKFLGTWSIDSEGNNSKLEDLEGNSYPVSVVGYKLVEDDVREASEVEFEAKIAKEKEELEEKNTKKAADFDKKVKKLNYERRIQQLNMETYLEIKHRQEYMKNIKKQSKPTSMLTDS